MIASCDGAINLSGKMMLNMYNVFIFSVGFMFFMILEVNLKGIFRLRRGVDLAEDYSPISNTLGCSYFQIDLMK